MVFQRAGDSMQLSKFGTFARHDYATPHLSCVSFVIESGACMDCGPVVPNQQITYRPLPDHGKIWASH
eukprot:SAG31_NODE_5906_length_2263_cov_1.831793_4_plen_68_part_00